MVQDSKTIKDAVGIILEQADGTIILVTPRKWADDVFVVPGGKIKPGESAEEAVEREMQEEFNWELGVNFEITYRDPKTKLKEPGADYIGKPTLRFHDFYGRVLSEQGLKYNEDEIRDVHIATPEEFLKMHEEEKVILGELMPDYLKKFIAWRDEQSERTRKLHASTKKR